MTLVTTSKGYLYWTLLDCCSFSLGRKLRQGKTDQEVACPLLFMECRRPLTIVYPLQKPNKCNTDISLATSPDPELYYRHSSI